MKDGRLQRFCQQCGRFHDLSAFDGNRKSCREQLQKHNARRRRRAQLEAGASLAGELVTAVDEKTEVGKLLQGLLSNPFQLQALRVLLGVKTHPALPDQQGFPAEHEAALEGAAAASAADPGAAGPGGPASASPSGSGSGSGTAGGSNPPSYEVARDIMEGAGPYAPDFDSDHRALRLCVKMFNATPADLPPDLKAQVTGWLAQAPLGLESHIRPGCVMLTVQMLVSDRWAAFWLVCLFGRRGGGGVPGGFGRVEAGREGGGLWFWACTNLPAARAAFGTRAQPFPAPAARPPHSPQLLRGRAARGAAAAAVQPAGAVGARVLAHDHLHRAAV